MTLYKVGKENYNVTGIEGGTKDFLYCRREIKMGNFCRMLRC